MVAAGITTFKVLIIVVGFVIYKNAIVLSGTPTLQKFWWNSHLQCVMFSSLSCFDCKPAVMANCLFTISSAQFLTARCERTLNINCWPHAKRVQETRCNSDRISFCYAKYVTIGLFVLLCVNLRRLLRWLIYQSQPGVILDLCLLRTTN